MFRIRRKNYGKYLRVGLMMAEWMMFNIFFGVLWHLFPVLAHVNVPGWVLWLLVNVSFVPVAVRMTRQPLRAIRLDKVLFHALNTVGLHALFFLSFITIIGVRGIPVVAYGAYYGMMATVFAVWSVVSRRMIKSYRRRGYNFTRVVIVGTNNTARRLYQEMMSDPGFGYRVLSFFDIEERERFADLPCHMLDELDRFVKEFRVDQIYYTMSGHDDALSSVTTVSDANMVEFFYVPRISRYIKRGFHLDSVGQIPVLTVRLNPLKSGVNKMLKRAFDILVSGIFLCFYPLIYIPIAIAIKLSSPGPVYFKQSRTGYMGKTFQCYKFRTMKVNVDADRAQATADDPRKTRLGDFLRRTSLDELPQFINVFKGDMSIVGPRPHMLKHTEDYSKIIGQYMVRHFIKPGITGWAQVNGYRGATDELWKMEKRVEYDVWYMENWTLLLDLKIIVRTALNVFKGEENAF